MSVKNIAPDKKSKFYQGYYNPINKEKYIGNIPIIYRSNLERLFCIYLDKNSNVIKWSSESICVNYHNPIKNKEAKYYPDFFAIIKNQDFFIKYVFEVKPYKLIPIKENQKKLRKNNKYDYEQKLINKNKYIAIKKYCDLNNIKFSYITEKFFNL